MPINFQSEQLNIVWMVALNALDEDGATQILRWCGPSSRTSGITVETAPALGAAYEPRGGEMTRLRDLGGLKNNILIPTRLGLRVDLGADDADLRKLALSGSWAGQPITGWRAVLDDNGVVIEREIWFRGRVNKNPTVHLDQLYLVGGSFTIGLRMPWPMGKPVDMTLFTDTTDGVTSGSDTSIANSNGGTFHPSVPQIRDADAERYIPLVFGDSEARSGSAPGYVWRRAVYVGRGTIRASRTTGLGTGGAASDNYCYFFYLDHRTGTGSADSLWVEQVRFEAPDTSARPHIQGATLGDGATIGTTSGSWLASGGYLDTLGLYDVYEVLDDTAGIGPTGTYLRVTSEFDIDFAGEGTPQCMARMAGRNRGQWDTAWNSAPDPHISSGAVRVLKRSTTPPADADWQILRDVFTDAQLLDLGASADIFETATLSNFDSSAPVGPITGDRWRRFSCCVPLEPVARPPKVREVLQDLLNQVGADLCEVYEPSAEDLRIRVMRRRPNPSDSAADHLLLEGELVTGDRSDLSEWRVEDDPDNYSATDVAVTSATFFRDPIRIGASSVTPAAGSSDTIDPTLSLAALVEGASYYAERDDESVVGADVSKYWVPLEHVDGGGGFKEQAQFTAEARQQSIRVVEIIGGFRWMRFDPGDTVDYLMVGLEALPTGHIRAMKERIGDEVMVALRTVHASFFASSGDGDDEGED